MPDRVYYSFKEVVNKCEIMIVIVTTIVTSAILIITIVTFAIFIRVLTVLILLGRFC